MNIHTAFYKIKWVIFEENPKMFRFLTLLSFLIACILERVMNYDKHPASFFTFVMVIAGMSSFNVIQQLLISLFATFIKFHPIEFSFDRPGPVFFIIQVASHFIVCFIISYLIKIQTSEYKNMMNFIKTLAKTIESRDTYTASHSMKVAEYSRAIAEKLNYSESTSETVFVGALLHDIGKIGIKDSILNKPSKLTDEEYTLIKQHPLIGAEMLKLIENFKENKILDMILYHHERYDGTGYPKRLRGNEIPQCASIVAVADAFDAITSKRIYREEHNIEYAINELIKGSGSQFDPIIVDAFITYLTETKITENKFNI